MNNGYHLLVLAHILLLVFWLGTDIGVFVSALWLKKRCRTAGERMLLLQLAGLLDVMPRLCSALMLPLGVTLAEQHWGLAVSAGVLAAMWLVALVWCVAIVAAYRAPESPLAIRIGKVQTIGLAIGAVAATLWGLSLLNSNDVPTWVAIKIALFGLVYLLAIGIDVTFRPVIQLLVAMPDDGGDKAQQAALSSAINLCCAVVLVLYVVVIASSALGALRLPQ